MIWLSLFFVHLNSFNVHAYLSTYINTAQSCAWSDFRQKCTLVSNETLCENSWTVCKRKFNFSNNNLSAWIDGHIKRSPWYTYGSKTIDDSVRRKLDSFNPKQIGSNCASIRRIGNDIIFEHRPCEDQLQFICTKCPLNRNCSDFVSNYTKSWDESRLHCEKENNTLVLRHDTIQSELNSSHYYWIGYYRTEEVIWGKDAKTNTGGITCLAVGENGTVEAINCSFHLYGICVFQPTGVQSHLNWVLFPASFGISVVIGLVFYLLCLIVVLIIKRCRIQNDVDKDNDTLTTISPRNEHYFDPYLTDDSHEVMPCSLRRSLSTFPMKSQTISGRIVSKGCSLPFEWRHKETQAEFQSDQYLNRDPQPLPYQEPSNKIMIHHRSSSLQDLNTSQDRLNAVALGIPCIPVQKTCKEVTDERHSSGNNERVDSESVPFCHTKVQETCKQDVVQSPYYKDNVKKPYDSKINSPAMVRSSFLLRLNNVLKFSNQKNENQVKVKSNRGLVAGCKYEKDSFDTVELKRYNNKSEELIEQEDQYIKMNHPRRQSACNEQDSGYVSMTDPKSTRKVKVDEHGYAEVH